MTVRRTIGLPASALVLLCVGCTTTQNRSDEPREERTYRTGSNLPSKDYGTTGTTKTLDPEALRDAARRNASPRPGSGP